MKDRLFHVFYTKNTIMAVKMHVFSSEQVPGIKSIPEQQPKEKLMLILSSYFPHPFDEWRGWKGSSEAFVSILAGDVTRSPNMFIIQHYVTGWNLVEDYTQYSMALMFLHYLSIVVLRIQL